MIKLYYYLNKMIYAEKYMPAWQWKIWRLAFKAYLKFKWPAVARAKYDNEEDYQIGLKASYMAFEDHKRIKKVGLPELEDASRRLGSVSSWGS